MRTFGELCWVFCCLGEIRFEREAGDSGVAAPRCFGAGFSASDCKFCLRGEPRLFGLDVWCFCASFIDSKDLSRNLLASSARLELSLLHLSPVSSRAGDFVTSALGGALFSRTGDFDLPVFIGAGVDGGAGLGGAFCV